MTMQRRNARRPVRAGELYNARQPKRRRNWACCVLIAVIFVGSVLQVWQLAGLMGQNKRIAEESTYVRTLRDEVRNTQNLILQHTNLEVISREAAKLGMVAVSEDTEIRNVPVAVMAKNSDTNAQTAYGGQD